MNARDPERRPTHPGELLREDIVPSLAYSKMQLAGMLSISRQHFYDILNERKLVSASVATRLGKLLGYGPLFWIRMQDAYDAWHAERDVDVSNVPTLTVA
jgi:addiction module HigA family antidote